jgi:hypothetical protein
VGPPDLSPKDLRVSIVYLVLLVTYASSIWNGIANGSLMHWHPVDSQAKAASACARSCTCH